jgi:hypothetical protein
MTDGTAAAIDPAEDHTAATGEFVPVPEDFDRFYLRDCPSPGTRRCPRIVLRSRLTGGTNRMRKMLTAVALIALLAAACGDDDTAGGSEQLPPDPAATCPEGTPDCNDTPGLAEPPILPGEPDEGVDPGAGSPMVVDGGLTVSEALAGDVAGPIAVSGFVVEDAGGLRLCEVLLESYPPQCGGASIPLADTSTVDPDELQTAQGVTWTDYPVTVLGEVVDGVLVPTPLSA